MTFIARPVDNSSAAHRSMDKIVVRAQNGDRHAFTEIYEQYCHNIYGYVEAIVRDTHAAEDITQQVFINAMRNLGQYVKTGSAPFFAWLIRIARNQAIDHLRRESKMIPVECIWTNSSPGVEDRYGNEFLDAIHTLSPKNQRVILLRDVVGMEPREVEKLLGCTDASLHGQTHRARANLRKELIQQNAGPCVMAA